MKFNKWTLGLAAVGAVSMASAVRADETTPHLDKLNTAVSSTVISGVVDTGYQQSLGSHSKTTLPGSLPSGLPISNYYGVGNNVDGFNASQILISLDKALDETPWASGYHIDLNWGDAAINGISGSPLRQGYVTLRTPVGNGIDWKVGVFDGVTGYEGNTLSSNPNYTRSFAWQVNPASFTGVIGNYKVCDFASVQAGVANRGTTWGIFGQSADKTQSKDYIMTGTLTAPESFGFLSGSTLNLQTVQGFDEQSVANYSVNATLNTPVTGFKIGLAYDALNNTDKNLGFLSHKDLQIFGAYATYQATDKLSFALRGEYLKADTILKGEEVTATVAYNLWQNVVSRVEFRWDHAESAQLFGTDAAYSNAYMIAANVAYKF